jgi:hypothetical protein
MHFARCAAGGALLLPDFGKNDPDIKEVIWS